jgi:hypothetical protein
MASRIFAQDFLTAIVKIARRRFSFRTATLPAA